MIPAWLTGVGMKIGVAIAALAIIVGGWLYIGKLQAENKTLSAQVSEVEAVNQQDVKAITGYQAAVAAEEGAELDLDKRLAAMRAGVSRQRTAIAAQAAQPGQDGAVAPVLSATLDSLRGAK